MQIFLKKLSEYIIQQIKENEKTIFFAIFLILTFFIIKTLSDHYTITIPKNGGIIDEITIENNSIKYINPVFATNQAEKDLVSLIYSSLMKFDKNGKLVKNIANYEVSNDGLEYTINLKKDIFFHDGKQLTADDVIFTIELIQNPIIKSPLYSNWANIKLEKINDFKLKFILKSRYNQFSNFFTLHILPKHLLKDFKPQRLRDDIFNLEPIGSGDFIFEKRTKNSLETTYFLKKNEKNDPFIQKIIYHSFNNLNSFEKSKIYNNSSKIKNISSIYPSDINLSEYNIHRINIPKINFLFFNLNSLSPLSDTSLRKAISVAISKDEIIDTALDSNAIIANSFRPWKEDEILSEKRVEKIKRAVSILKKAGWKKNDDGIFEKNNKKAEIKIDIIDYKEFELVTKIIAKNLSDIGVKVSVSKNSPIDYINNIIVKKNYEATLFGHDSNIHPDVYFFLSSEFNNPINISNLNSPKINILAKKLRISKNKEEINKLFREIEEEVFEKKIPMIPLYSPNFTYLSSKKINIPNIKLLENKESRFSDIKNWYIKTERILPFFQQ